MPLTALDTVEDAQVARITEAQHELIDSMRARWFVGESGEVAERLTGFAARYEVDEVMVSPSAASSVTDPIDRAPARERTLELLAAHLPQGALAAA